MSDDLLERSFDTTLHVRAEPDGERIIEGMVVPFDVETTVADRAADGSFRPPYRERIARGATDGLDPARVTLESSEHRGKLVGRGISAEATPDGLNMALRVAKTPAGDELLELAREGVLTSMSIVFMPVRDRQVNGVVERTAIDIRRVAVLERGAYPSAQVTAVRAAPEPPEDPAPSPKRSTTVDQPILSIEDKRARVAELNAELQRTAESTSGPLPEEEQVAWNTDVDERDRLQADINSYDERQAQLAVIVRDQPPGGIERYTPPTNRNVIVRKSESELHSPETRSTSYEGAMAEYRDDAMHLLERTQFAYGIADQAASADRVSALLANDSPTGEMARRVKYSSAPAYLSAFHKFITSRGQTFHFTAEEQRGTALAVGVDGTGGFMVPFAFDPTVIAIGVNNGAVNPYRRACRVVSIVGTDTWNALTATVVVATRTTEAAPATEQGPTFAQPQYIVTRVQGQITASFEMFQDRADLASELSGLIQEAKDNEEESSMATGATAAANIGVGPVSGTSGAYTAVASTAGAGLLAAADFLATEAALPVRHRFNAQWFMNRINIRKAQALETTGGQLFGGSQYPAVGNVDQTGTGNTGLRLLGYPVNESPSLPTATTTTITAATLANVSSYVIVDRIGLFVQFLPYLTNSSALATGQAALYFMYRNTAKPINVDAGRTLRFQ